MSNAKHFTAEEMDHLRINHYVKSISPSTIKFTEEFKRYFCQKREEGVAIRDIFLECGIDPDILGERRIHEIAQKYPVRVHDAGWRDYSPP